MAVKEIRARKTHSCDMCERTIEPGDIYEHHSDVFAYDDEEDKRHVSFVKWKKCPSCIFLTWDKCGVLIFRNLPQDLIMQNSYGVPQSDWEEPVLLRADDDLYAKYRVMGMPFKDLGHGNFTPMIGAFRNKRGVWEEMPGYIEPSFAPGRSWREEIVPKEYADKMILKP